ncbi:hypothetical protein IOQ85_000011 [Listeria monocytogenes]|nr:hypothetical protein [Listeria monocytogenes]MBC2359266.1 hypothetical protein [Listeria welshimeri]EGK2607921.1 hypothetical protein [Listeria monocytogenes]MCJ19245.1 hypothetical protein [Listeria monocytogenes]HAA4850104.1 hypothetical protein [Listeria monocytogenes]
MAVKDERWSPVARIRVGDFPKLAKIYKNKHKDDTFTVAFLSVGNNVIRVGIGPEGKIYTFVDSWKAGELIW